MSADEEARRQAKAHLAELRADLGRAPSPPPPPPRAPSHSEPSRDGEDAGVDAGEAPSGPADLGSTEVAYRMELAAHRDTLMARLVEKDARIADLEEEVGRLRRALADVADAIGQALHPGGRPR